MPVMDVDLSRKLQVEKVTMDSNRNGRRKIGEAGQSEGHGLLGCKSECNRTNKWKWSVIQQFGSKIGYSDTESQKCPYGV